MAGIFSALSSAWSITDTMGDIFGNGLSDKEKAEKIKALIGKTNLIRTDGSITKLVSRFVIEPFIIVSKDAKESEVIDKIIEANLDLFSSYYMQAFNILTSIEKLDVSVAVRLLGTDNGGVASAAQTGLLKYLSREDHDFSNEVDKLMKSGGFLSIENDDDFYKQARHDREESRDNRESLKFNLDTKLSINRDNRDKRREARDIEKHEMDKMLSANKDSRDQKKFERDMSPVKHKYSNRSEIMANDSLNKVTEQPTYSLLQRNLEIVVTMDTISKHSNGKIDRDKDSGKIIIPITIKALVIYAGRDSILNMLAPNSRDKRFGSRLDEYRAGAITFKELIFAGDLIKQYKANRMADKEGLIKLTNERIVSANSKVIDQGVVGFDKFYNMIIMTNDDKVYFNRHIGGDISNEKYKQDFMNQANAIATTILDDDYERADMLIKDIRGNVDIGYKSIAKRKSKDLDLTEIMKAFAANKPPVF